jgi:outer membrane lipoprotein-sorting protein
MNRRTLLALPLLSALTPWVPGFAQKAPPLQPIAFTPQDRADLARIEVYLNGLRTLKARFLQVSPDGGATEGNAWLQRPGRMRFEYDKPSPFLLVAGFGSAVFYDSQLNQTTSVPLATTPLGILLADNFKLSGDITVTAINRLPGQIQVTTIRTASPADGSLTLVFADAPLALRQWAVVDGQRQETRVSLFGIELGGNFPARMFEFNDPRFKSNNQN